MHIYFIGQKGIQAQRITDFPEMRTEVLAKEVAKSGHAVTVASTKIYAKQGKIASHSVTILPLPTALYSLFSCIKALIIKPNTIHVQGLRAGILLATLLPFMPKTTSIWTIPALPEISNLFVQRTFQFIVPFVASQFDAICTPTRTVQYRLLSLYSVKSEYIPDGYQTPTLPDIRPAEYGLRKEQYSVLLSDNMAQIKQISALFRSLKQKKKLIVFSSVKYPGITSINLPLISRGAQSLVRQAAFVIAADPSYSPLVLQAMDTGRAVIATTNPLHEELLGTTAQYYQENDSIGLLKLLSGVVKGPAKNNSAAQLRAKNHFSWKSAEQAYLRLYRHSRPVLVPFDSIIAKNSFPIPF